MNKIKLIVGLGNPGRQFHFTRHNIGFLVVDALAEKYGSSWNTKDGKEIAEITVNDEKVMLLKPQTFMNNSGKVIPALLKRGITVDNMLVIHDELEKPFGTVTVKVGGSHKGHNGLRSIMAHCGGNFVRLRCGIGRPECKEDVANYVLAQFTESSSEVSSEIERAVHVVEQLLAS